MTISRVSRIDEYNEDTGNFIGTVVTFNEEITNNDRWNIMSVWQGVPVWLDSEVGDIFKDGYVVHDGKRYVLEHDIVFCII